MILLKPVRQGTLFVRPNLNEIFDHFPVDYYIDTGFECDGTLSNRTSARKNYKLPKFEATT